jgi:hypothetical protein
VQGRNLPLLPPLHINQPTTNDNQPPLTRTHTPTHLGLGGELEELARVGDLHHVGRLARCLGFVAKGKLVMMMMMMIGRERRRRRRAVCGRRRSTCVRTHVCARARKSACSTGATHAQRQQQQQTFAGRDAAAAGDRLFRVDVGRVDDDPLSTEAPERSG